MGLKKGIICSHIDSRPFVLIFTTAYSFDKDIYWREGTSLRRPQP